MKTVFIGCGNLACTLSQIMQKAGFDIVQIYSRTETSAKVLADILDAPYITDISKVFAEAELYVVAVSDSAIESIAEKMRSVKGLVVHTAGSIPMSVFAGKIANYGVLYPLQRFSKALSASENVTSISDVPLFVEANTEDNLRKLVSFAEKFSNRVCHADSDKRMKLHLAAVFACNFVNHLYNLSAHIVRQTGFDFAVLAPLISRTASVAINSNNPNVVQTGPAARNDCEIIEKHKNILCSQPELKEIYAILSENIIKITNKCNE